MQGRTPRLYQGGSYCRSLICLRHGTLILQAMEDLPDDAEAAVAATILALALQVEHV